MKYACSSLVRVLILWWLLLASSAPAQTAPPNGPATMTVSEDGTLTLEYHGAAILTARFKSGESSSLLPASALKVTQQVEGADRVTQRITIAAADHQTSLTMDGSIAAGPEAFAAETGSRAQERFPLVRNSVGPSRSLRNNAVYDRGFDWVLSGPEDHTRIVPGDGDFQILIGGPSIEIIFRPRFFQRHKNIRYFRPWEYRIKQRSVTGWCSWWAYMNDFTETDLDELLQVWKEQRLIDYGYRYIQIDATYQQPPEGPPEHWLEWNSKFPSGMSGYSAKVRAIGADPAIWLNTTFGDRDFVDQHPDWFLRDQAGQPFFAPWVNYVQDPTVPAVVENIIRPIYGGIHDQGFTYVKIDGIRHFLYDGLRNQPWFAASKGMTSADLLRTYLSLARQELGPDTFVLGCWGVIPETAGIVDSIRLGGDGFGPATLQQYNSWNGVVWRNDPDHCDVRPSLNQSYINKWLNWLNRLVEPKQRKAPAAESIIRPTIASLAGAVLLLSDRAEVYRDPTNLEGAKRASPVLFTVPGQLYDYETSRSDQVRELDPDTITSGKNPSPFDARQRGHVAPWWLLEIDRPFEHWNVLGRLNWNPFPLPPATVAFADLGLEPDRDYLVYEFWTRKFLGVHRGSFAVPTLVPQGTRIYAIRELQRRPQVLSTNRHLSQGGVDLVEVKWDEANRILSGQSRVVQGDRYEITLHLPEGFTVRKAGFDGWSAALETDGEVTRLSFEPEATGTVAWSIEF